MDGPELPPELGKNKAQFLAQTKQRTIFDMPGSRCCQKMRLWNSDSKSISPPVMLLRLYKRYSKCSSNSNSNACCVSLANACVTK